MKKTRHAQAPSLCQAARDLTAAKAPKTDRFHLIELKRQLAATRRRRRRRLLLFVCLSMRLSLSLSSTTISLDINPISSITSFATPVRGSGANLIPRRSLSAPPQDTTPKHRVFLQYDVPPAVYKKVCKKKILNKSSVLLRRAIVTRIVISITNMI